MPLTMEFSEDDSGVSLVVKGVITGKEIIEAGNKLFSDERVEAIKYWLLDRTECTEYHVNQNEVSCGRVRTWVERQCQLSRASS